MTLEEGSEHPGVANLGRPTFDPAQELLEAHLFDFDADLYGRKIEVALHAYIREEKRFEGIGAADCPYARGTKRAAPARACPICNLMSDR